MSKDTEHPIYQPPVNNADFSNDQAPQDLNRPFVTTKASDPDASKKSGSSSSENIHVNEKCPQGISDNSDELEFEKLTICDEDKLNLSGGSPQESREPEEYRLKWITWRNQKIPILTQNQNGPCPLIAIANILLLRGKISLSQMATVITAEELITHIANNIVESKPNNTSEDLMRNFEQNMHDAMSLLPQLYKGLDVNVKFTGVSHFEYTEACTVFDLLNISLYHGWVVDPQALDVVNAVGSMGYNQLVETVIHNKVSDDPSKVTNALIAEQFLEGSASQLTYHGLCELNSVMADDELAVLFRNNHFSTIFKRTVHKELFLLVTDQGFLHESNVVWEMLCNIEGDSMFVDSNFTTVPPKASCSLNPPIKDNLTEEQQIDQDYMVALAMQEDMRRLDESWEDVKVDLPDENLSDEEFARWLYMKEMEEADKEDRERSRVSLSQSRAKRQTQSKGQPPLCTCPRPGNERRPASPSSSQTCPTCNGQISANISGSPTNSLPNKKNTCSVL